MNVLMKTMRMAVIFGFVAVLGMAGTVFCANGSLVVTEDGNVGIGTTNLDDRLQVYNAGNNPVTVGIRGKYPSINVDGTYNYKQFEIGPNQLKIPENITDNGYRIGCAILNHVRYPDFKGTLRQQIAAWITTGIYSKSEATGTINSSIALHIDNFSCPTAQILDSYAIYQSSENAKNYFHGPICVNTINPGSYKLYVKGDMYATRIKTSILPNEWQDSVFEDTYELPSLFDVEDFIKQNKHLPEVPSAEELGKTGLDAAKMLSLHMKKIEELTLYAIELKKENEALKDRLEQIETKLGM